MFTTPETDPKIFVEFKKKCQGLIGLLGLTDEDIKSIPSAVIIQINNSTVYAYHPINEDDNPAGKYRRIQYYIPIEKRLSAADLEFLEGEVERLKGT